MNKEKIFFIGAGKMATAIVKGMLNNGFSTEQISAFDISAEAAAHFQHATGMEIAPEDAITEADIVVIAVKPQMLDAALSGKRIVLQKKLIISIAAGVNLKKLGEVTTSKRLIRVMPNLPAIIGSGVSGYATSPDITADDIKTAEKIMGSIGIFEGVPEKMLDAVTGLSGSGPAFVFDFIQALADGGVAAGLPRNVALKFAAATVAGAAKLTQESDLHPGELRDQVMSPGGTTAEGIKVLENSAFRGSVINAVIAAALKSEALSK